jgi:hypothetical protein
MRTPDMALAVQGLEAPYMQKGFPLHYEVSPQ